MLKKQIVKTTSLFTLIFAFMAIGMTANASVMNGDKEKVAKAEKEKPTLAPQWFTFTGDPNNPSQVENPNFYQPYVPTETNPDPTCEEGTKLCAIKAQPDQSNQNIPDEDDLLDVLERNDGSPSPDRSEIRHQP